MMDKVGENQGVRGLGESGRAHYTLIIIIPLTEKRGYVHPHNPLFFSSCTSIYYYYYFLAPPSPSLQLCNNNVQTFDRYCSSY